MAGNLPEGVTPGMIPGDRPEDIALDQMHEAIDEALRITGLSQIFRHLKIATDGNQDPTDRCEAIGQIFDYIDQRRYEDRRGLDEWIDQIENASCMAEANDPEPPEPDPYDY